MSNFVLTDADAALTVSQRSTIVKLLDSKVFDLGDPISDHDGEAVEFENGDLVTFGDLAYNEPRAEGSGRHFPVVCGLTKGQASGVIAELISSADKPKSNNRPKAGRGIRRNQPKAEIPEQVGNDLSEMVTSAVAKLLGEAGILPKAATPAKPEPAKNHRLVRPQPAKPVEVKPVELAEGQIVKIGDDLFEVKPAKRGGYSIAKIK